MKLVRASGIVGGLAAVLLVAACSEPSTVSVDYRDNHPVTVFRDEVRLSVPAPVPGVGLAGEDRTRMQRFAREYLARGDGVVLLQMTGPVEGGADGEILRSTHAMLLAEGLRNEEIAVLPGTSSLAGEPTVILTFSGYRAELPDCGDWSAPSAFRPQNQPHGNYGCAYQRNIGAMIENPRDLVRARTMTDRDPARSILTIERNRERELSNSPKTVEQTDMNKYTTGK